MDDKPEPLAGAVPDTSPGVVVNMLLCDAAQVAGGKLSLLGGGLAVIGPKPQPMAIGIHISVPWDQANTRHEWRLELIDEDGRPALVNKQPLVATGHFEAGRPAGLRPGSPLPMALAINFPPFRVPPGRAFQFRFGIDGQTRPEWSVRFFTREAPPTQPDQLTPPDA